jgi:glycerol-3-phosphate dehydrogenase (NAD(P)+)
MRALVVGATSWGCTLALQLGRAGTEVDILCRSMEEATDLARTRENRRLLPGIILPESINFVVEATPSDLVILAVPAQHLRTNLRAVLPGLAKLAPIVSAAKGLEVETRLRMSQVVEEELHAAGVTAPIAAISGPNLAREIATGQPATTVVASADAETAAMLQAALMTASFRVYTNPDLIGVELAGALKNVVAIGVGIGDALNAGENGRAAFLTRGLAEIARLGVALGANPLTFTGLAGLGDLIATAASPRSRNRSVGVELGRGRPLDEILASMVHVAEGVPTTRAACRLAADHGVDMPIAQTMHRVLFDGLSPARAVQELMTRDPQAETSGL